MVNRDNFVVVVAVIGLVVLAWTLAAVLLGAGVSRYSLRLQQLHASNSIGAAVVLPLSFLHGVLNLQHYFSGLWLLDLYFCLHPSGLARMSVWSKMYARGTERTICPRSNNLHDDESFWMIWQELALALATSALQVGTVGMSLLLLLEADRIKINSHSSQLMLEKFYGFLDGVSFVQVGAVMAAALLFIRIAQHAYSFKDDMKHAVSRFHDQLRESRYGVGSKLVNL